MIGRVSCALLACLTPAAAQAPWQPVTLKPVTTAHSIAFAVLANAGKSSTTTGSGTYTGTAPSSISSATWSSGCASASSTVTGFTAAGGTWSATFSTPSTANACTLSITDNLTNTAISPSAAVGFIGDVVSSWLFWGGNVAYTSAIAASGTQPAYNFLKPINSVSCDVLIATTGYLGNTISTCNGSTQGNLTPAAFAGTDASGAGSISGTTMTFTGGHVGDMVTGAGVAPGTYIQSGSSPTWTVYPSQVTSGTFTLLNALICNRIYDQANPPTNFASVYSTTAGQTAYFVSTGGASATSGYCATNGVGGSSWVISLGGGSVSQPFTVAVIANQTVSAANYEGLFSNGTPNFTGFNYQTTNFVNAYAGNGAAPNVAATDGVFHAFYSVFNGASSSIQVDGALTSGNSIGTNAMGAGIGVAAPYAGGAFGTDGLVGGVVSAGIVSGAISTGNQTILNALDHLWEGF